MRVDGDNRVRVLIVKLSSLGDVVHAMPVVHDILAIHPNALIDWVVEPGFAPLVRRVVGVNEVIECALRRWTKAWWTTDVRAEWRAFRARLQRHRYDVVLDLQGLTKSAVIARMAHGTSYGMANRTDGSSFETPARWLVKHAIRIEPRTHALDRSRELAARALGNPLQGSPCFGLKAYHPHHPHQAVSTKSADVAQAQPAVVFVHGTSRDDKLWPEANWIELGRRVIAQGWRIALPHAGALERSRAQRLQAALGSAVEIWPAMGLDALTDRMGESQGVIGVDSGLSHIAVALNLPHVQLYNFPTAWRTGPQEAHGHHHQVSVQGEPVPPVDTVWTAWMRVRAAASA